MTELTWQEQAKAYERKREELQRATEERWQCGKGHSLHVFQEDEDTWSAWLNTETQDFDGLCLGTGKTRSEAVTEAVKTLETATDLLQGPPRK